MFRRQRGRFHVVRINRRSVAVALAGMLMALLLLPDARSVPVALTGNRRSPGEVLRLTLTGAEVDTALSLQLAEYPQGVIHKGDSNKQAVTLMINVDWGTPELEQMLSVLKQRGARVTFFVSGTWAQQNRDLLHRMAQEGHEIATHGYRLSHGPRELARTGRLKADISKSVAVIEEITGQKVRYYAPHMSEISQEIVETAASLQLRTVLPSLDTVDWHNQTTPQLILNRLQKAGPGDLILMHPKPNTAQVLDAAIRQLEARGLKPVTLSEMLGDGSQVPVPDHSTSTQ